MGVRGADPPKVGKNSQEFIEKGHVKLINLITFQKFNDFLRGFDQT